MRKNLVKALKFITISAIICVSFVVSSQKTTAASAINRAINYQGRLLNANGIPVSDGNYSLKFSLYDAVSGGNTLWTASGATSSPAAVSVTVTSGLFSYNLGDTSTGQNAFDFDWNQNSLFLGVTVASDSEMSPRKRLTAVPYAFVAETLQGQYASSSVTSTGGNLFALRQNSANAATSGQNGFVFYKPRALPTFLIISLRRRTARTCSLFHVRVIRPQQEISRLTATRFSEMTRRII